MAEEIVWFLVLVVPPLALIAALDLREWLGRWSERRRSVNLDMCPCKGSYDPVSATTPTDTREEE